MASRRPATASRAEPLALELLINDHRAIDALLEQYEAEKDGDEDTKRAIAESACGELTAHAQVEEELFYPWLRENLDEGELEMVEEALLEHASAREIIEQVESAAQVDTAYDARMKVLGEYIRHHVKEEEEEIFPAIRGRKESLDALGQEMAARKAELMEELGLDSEDMGLGENAVGPAMENGGRFRDRRRLPQ